MWLETFLLPSQAVEFAEHSHPCNWSLVGSHWPTQIFSAQTGHGGNSENLCGHGLHHDRSSRGQLVSMDSQAHNCSDECFALTATKTKNSVLLKRSLKVFRSLFFLRKRASTFQSGVNTTGWPSELDICMRILPVCSVTFSTATCSRPTTLL